MLNIANYGIIKIGFNEIINIIFRRKAIKSLRKKIKDEKYIDFGQWLYETRKEKGYTELELVEKINQQNVQEKNVKKWERDLDFPDLDAIYKLSEIYGIPSAEIIEKKNETLHKGVEGINMFVIRMLSLMLGISIYGTIIISNILIYGALILVFIWFCNIR